LYTNINTIFPSQFETKKRKMKSISMTIAMLL